jgi:hypothetical protein
MLFSLREAIDDLARFSVVRLASKSEVCGIEKALANWNVSNACCGYAVFRCV